MKTLVLTAALVALTAAAAGARGLHGRAAHGEGPGGGPGGSSTAVMQVRIRVVAASGVAFSREQGVRSAGVQGGRIVVEDTQAGELAIEVWKAVNGAATAGRGDRVAAGAVRLRSDATGRARGEAGPAVAGALRAAAVQPGVYTVAVAY